MRKLLKIVLWTVSTVVCLILLFAAWFYWSMWSMQRQAKIDGPLKSEQCDAVRFITEHPEIDLIGFRVADIRDLTFYLKRNQLIVKDTLIKTGFTVKTNPYAMRIPIPFDQFLKTDTVIIKTHNKLYYKLSGFHHFAYLQYGMFGYLGSSDCRLSDNCTINGKDRDRATLLKTEGLDSQPFTFTD